MSKRHETELLADAREDYPWLQGGNLAHVVELRRRMGDLRSSLHDLNMWPDTDRSVLRRAELVVELEALGWALSRVREHQLEVQRLTREAHTQTAEARRWKLKYEAL